MAAQSNLVADDPRRVKKAARSSGLVVAWMLLVTMTAALLAWLFANADETRARWSMKQPSAVVALPSDVPSQWQKQGAEPAPAPAAPPPVAAAPAVEPPVVAPLSLAPPPIPTAPEPPRGLGPAPDPALVETTPMGPLPKIGPDGRQPWQAYARPFTAPDKAPRIAVMITGLGLAAQPTEAAIGKLPPEVTLGFSPYAERLGEWLAAAREAGHEVFIDLPLEPVNFPQHDPGPYTLLSTLSAGENAGRLEWVLSRGVGYVGVVGQFGSRFTTSGKFMIPVFDHLKKRGIMFVDAKATPESVAGKVARDMGVPRASSDRVIDAEGGRAAVDAKLAEIERLARGSGSAVAFASPYPITIDRLLAWIPIMQQRGFALAPVSAVANRQKE